MREPFLAVDPGETIVHEDAFRVQKTRDGFVVEVAIVDTTSCGPELVTGVMEGIHRTTGSKPFHIWPKWVVAERFSFLPQKKTDAVVIKAILSSDFRLMQKPEVLLARIDNVHIVDYQDVPGIIHDQSHPLSHQLSLAAYVAHGLMEVRRKKGATGLIRVSPNMVTNDEGLIRTIASNRVAAYSIVGEFTGQANAWAAEFCHSGGPSILYSHQPNGVDPRKINLAKRLATRSQMPNPMKIEQMRQFLGIGPRRIRYGLTPSHYYTMGVPIHARFTAPVRRTIAFVNSHNWISFIKGEESTFSEDDLDRIEKALNAQTLRKERLSATNGKPWVPHGREKTNPVVRLSSWAARVGLIQPRYTTKPIDGLYRCVGTFHSLEATRARTNHVDAKIAVAIKLCKRVSI